MLKKILQIIFYFYHCWYRCDVTIISAGIGTRKQVLQALPGHDAVFLASHYTVNNEFLDIAGKDLFFFLSSVIAFYNHPNFLKQNLFKKYILETW